MLYIHTVSRPVQIALLTATKSFQKDATNYTAQTK